jgi:hypothetical protein
MIPRRPPGTGLCTAPRVIDPGEALAASPVATTVRVIADRQFREDAQESAFILRRPQWIQVSLACVRWRTERAKANVVRLAAARGNRVFPVGGCRPHRIFGSTTF